jgi:hypothetical protein
MTDDVLAPLTVRVRIVSRTGWVRMVELMESLPACAYILVDEHNLALEEPAAAPAKKRKAS